MNNIVSILFPDFPKFEQFMEIDLSVNNKKLNKIDLNSASEMDAYITDLLTKNSASVAYGGYLEKRAIYDRSPAFKMDKLKTQRNIHLGVDFWCKVGTVIAAPFAGIVHSFQNNKDLGNYGPTIILKHTLDGSTFYTLYGHLDIISLQEIAVGQVIEKGTVFCKLGEASVNGDYAPHLHFQIIKNIEKYSGDYPGVCSFSDLSYYKKNCPDPLQFFK